MRITKSINTNAALALDSQGNEIVVLGKGIGFPKTPYELSDLSKIQRTFYDVKSSYLKIIASLPSEILEVSAQITEMATLELKCELNPSLPFTLADHLSFAMERIVNGIQFPIPLACDIQHLYPTEYSLGVRALEIFSRNLGKELPDSEAVNIALHLINAESKFGDMHSTTIAIQVIEQVDLIIEEELGIIIDKSTFQYSRFATHIQYLVQRLMSNEQVEAGNGALLREMALEHPSLYRCATLITHYLHSTWGWSCNDDERLYIMLHIHRLNL